MTITATQSNSATTGAAAAPATGATGQLLTDFNMFLKLLTTQMQNQDPLNPMDTAQYTQQLVQYSQVEQSIKQNTTLKDILASLSTQNLAQSSALIGQEARFDGSQSVLGTRPAAWAWSSNHALSSLTATVTDSSGAVVATQAVDPAISGRFEWNGTLADGTKAAAGKYGLSLVGQDSAGNTATVGIQALAVVDSVSLDNGVVTLAAGSLQYPSSSVLGFSKAGTP
jgi:flagellar basal-body rod modification protein FlgD